MSKPITQEYRIKFLDGLPKNSICAEIGVHEGNWSEKITEITKPKELWLIDNFYQKSFYKRKFPKNVIIKIGNFEELYKNGVIKNNYFDWIYLDTFHTYEDSIKQLKICFNILKEGGLLTGDDYNDDFKGLKKAIHEFINDYSDYIHVFYLDSGVWGNRFQFRIKKCLNKQ